MIKGKEKKMAFLTISIFLLFFLVIDFVLGFVLIPPSFNDFRLRDRQYHHGLASNVASRAAWGPIIYPFYTNSLGFRDLTVRRVPLQADNKRILIMGDSHSEGVGIDYPYTFAGRLQILGQSKGVDILNGSAVSYSPKIHLLKGRYLLNEVKLEIDELWIVIDISDLQNEIAYVDFVSSKQSFFQGMWYQIQRFFINHSFTVSSIVAIKNNKEFESLSTTLQGFQNDVSQLPSRTAIELYKEFFRHFGDKELLRDPNFHGVSEWIYDASLRELADQGLSHGMNNIAELNKICREKDIKMRLSVHPWQTQLMKGDTTDYYVERWREFCNTQNIGFTNLYPLFINEENPLWVAKTAYIEGDNHWSELGHARVAEYLSQYLN